MVDLCRPTTLSSNKSLGPNTANTSSINGNSNFFPSIFLPYSHMMNSDRQDTVTAALAAVVATSAMEHTRLEEEKLRVQAKGKKDQSANASPEVKTHLKSFLCRKLQKEGKLGSEDSSELLRRIYSAPVLPNPCLESGKFKIKSGLRQSILQRHRYLTPMSDKFHNMRSTSNLAQKQAHIVPPIPVMPFDSQPSIFPPPEQLWLDINDFQRSLYSCYSTGSLGQTGQRRHNLFDPIHENSNRTNILGPKHFIVEEENEALLARELQEAKIQSAHNSHSSMHSSQPQIFHDQSNDLSTKNSTMNADRSTVHSKSLSSLTPIAMMTDSKLSRALSETISFKYNTGIAYDDDILKHECYCKREDLHLENPRRLLVIYDELQKSCLLDECEMIRGHCATNEMLAECHSSDYIDLYMSDIRQRTSQTSIFVTQRLNSIVRLPCGGFGLHDDTDTIWNELYTARACRLAIGNTIAISKAVLDGKLKNGFAIVRPPGHHAKDTPLGFCYFNNVAVTAKYLKKHHNIQRIAIVDWDIHHGNGTQALTYDDPDILYLSLHRYDNGSYFPGGGRNEECGTGLGLGKNINIAFSGEPYSVMTDVEYIAAFRTVVMPILKEFQPEMILVSCGFDACEGHAHPLGGYELTPTCFAYMTSELMTLANGRLVLVLEGGYDLNALAQCSKACVETLLNKHCFKFRKETLETKPNADAVRTLKEVIEIQRKFWPSIDQCKHLVSMSHEKAMAS